jgi:hypothetical protein
VFRGFCDRERASSTVAGTRGYVATGRGRLVAWYLAAAMLLLGGACCCMAPPSAETVRVYPGPSSERLDPASSCTSVRARPYAHYSALPGSRVATYFAGTRSIFRQALQGLTSTDHSLKYGPADGCRARQQCLLPANSKPGQREASRTRPGASYSLLSSSYSRAYKRPFSFGCFLERGHESSGSEYDRFP